MVQASVAHNSKTSGQESQSCLSGPAPMTCVFGHRTATLGDVSPRKAVATRSKLGFALLLAGAVLTMGAKWIERPIGSAWLVAGAWSGTYTSAAGKKTSVSLDIEASGAYQGQAGAAFFRGMLQINEGRIQYRGAKGRTITLTLHERKHRRLLQGQDAQGDINVSLKAVKRRKEKSERIVADANAIRYKPPPRTIDDIREMVGTPPPAPRDCAQLQAVRRQAVELAAQRVMESESIPQNQAWAMMFVQAAEWDFARGNAKRAIDLSHRVIDKLAKGSYRWSRANLYMLLARMEAAIGDLSAADANFKLAKKEWRAFRRAASTNTRVINSYIGDWAWIAGSYGYLALQGHKESYELSTALGKAARAQALGQLPLAERYYRRALELTLSTATFKTRQVYADRVRLSAELTVNLVQQSRLAEAELQARDQVKQAFAKDLLGAFTARTAQLVTQLAAVYLEQDRLDDAEYLARLVITMHEVDCALPDSLTFLRARQVLARVLAAQGDWQGVLAQVDETRSALGDNSAAFERFFGTDVEWALALIHTGQGADGLQRLMAAKRRAIEENGANSYEAAEIRGLLGIARVATKDQLGALADFGMALPVLITGRDHIAGTTGGVTRSARASRIIDAYMALLTELHSTALADDANIDTAAELLQVASVAQLSSVQSALAASTSRAAARNRALAELVRRDQDASQQINATLDTLAYLDGAPPDQVNWSLQSALREQVLTLRAVRVKLAKEIRGRFPQYAQLMNPRPATLAEVQTALRPDEAVLVFHVTPERTYVWAIPKFGRATFVAAHIGRRELAQTVAHLRAALDPQAETLGDIPAFDLAAAWRLYETLLKPVESGWMGAKHLWVVPHGPLGQLPLAVLPIAPAERLGGEPPLFQSYRTVPWLARSHNISVLPSVASLITLRSLPPLKTKRRPFAGFGDPYFSQAQQAKAETVQLAQLTSGNLTVRGLPLTRRSIPTTRSVSSADLAKLPRLPDTAEEVKSIARALHADLTKDVFIGQQASEAQVKTMDLSDRRVIAFATHGLVPGDLDGLTQPALALSSPAVTGGKDDGLLTMGEILGLKLNADWIILSACNTAAANGKGAEAVSGLGRAFFYAGARALLVSNWPVETTSAKVLTTDLFKRQAKDPSLTRAQALQQAMLHLIDGPGRKDQNGRTLFSYAHPIFWAPFSLVGDGGGAAQ